MTPGPLEIRRATAADVAALRALGVRTWRAAHAGLLPPAAVEAGIDEWWNAYSLGAACRDGRMLVAVRDGAAVGLLESDRMADGRPVVWRLYVAPEAQRTGVGRALLRRHLETLPAGEELWLEHHAANAAARAFCDRLGFSVRAVEPSGHDPAARVVWRALERRGGPTPAT